MDNNDSFNNFNHFKKLNFGESFEPPKSDTQNLSIDNLGENLMPEDNKLEIKESKPQEEIPPQNNNNSVKKQPPKAKNSLNLPVRIVIYFLVTTISLALVFNQPITNAYFINNANKAYAQGDYETAFKNFKSAFDTNVDNKKYVAKYFSVMTKIEFYPIVQKEMIKLKKEYDNEKVNKAIDMIFDFQRAKILKETGTNYIDHTPTNSNIIHWNPMFSVVVKIDKNSVPDFYVTQIKNAFKDWSAILNNALTFEFNDSKKPNIEIVFVDAISGANEQYGQKIEILGSTEPYYSGKNLISTKIKFKKTDVDGSPLTENQIYNLALHEIGHAIGISGHSYNPNDVMYPTNNNAKWADDNSTLYITKKAFTADDANTINLFYKIIPDITNMHRFNEYKLGLYYPEVVLGNPEKIAQNKLKESQSYMTMISGNYISYMDLGEGYFATKNYDEAKKAFLSASRLAKDNIEFYNVYFNLAVTCYEAGEYQDAINYGGIANTYVNDKRANEVIGFSYIKLKRIKEAQKEFEELVKENPDNILFSYTLTDIYFSQYSIFKAFGEMKRIKSINPNALSDDTYKNYKIFGIFL